MKHLFIFFALIILACSEARKHFNKQHYLRFHKIHNRLQKYYKHKFNKHHPKTILSSRFIQRCPVEEAPDEPGWHKLIPEEFQLRILNEMICNIKWEVNIKHADKDKDGKVVNAHCDQTDYVESCEQNRAYRCFAARNLYFTQKMYYYYVGVVLFHANEKLHSSFNLQKIMALWDKIRKQTYYILAFSLNQVCHQEVPMVTHIFQQELHNHVEKLNLHKLELLEAIPQMMLNTFQRLFKNTPSVVPADKTDFKAFYQQIQFVITDQRRTPENQKEWLGIFTDLQDTHADLKETLGVGQPIAVSKRQSAIWYDRFAQFLSRVNTYYTSNLGQLPDKDQTLKRMTLVLDALAGGFLVLQRWPFYFLESQNDRACDKKELNLQNLFGYSEAVLWTDRCTGLLTEQMEVIRMFENLTEDVRKITDKHLPYTLYQTATRQIEQKLCFPEPELCFLGMVPQMKKTYANTWAGEEIISVVTVTTTTTTFTTSSSSQSSQSSSSQSSQSSSSNSNRRSFLQMQLDAKARHHNKLTDKEQVKEKVHHKAKGKIQSKTDDEVFKGVDWILNRIYSGFFRQLTALRKFGPISDLYITRTIDENRFLIHMGYQAVHLTHLRQENTLWICRLCHGQMAVSSIIVEENDQPDIPPVDHESHVRLRITDTHSIVMVKKFIELEHGQGNNKIDAVVSIVSDNSETNKMGTKWKRLAPLNLWITSATWQLDVRLWQTYPQHALLPITTWEEEKPSTKVIFTEGYCDDIKDKFSGKSVLVERWKNHELWLMDEASFDAYQATDHTPAAPGAIDIGGLVETGNSNACKIQQHFTLKFFSYITLMSDKDKDEFLKWQTEIWTHELLVTDLLDVQDKKQPLIMGSRQFYHRKEPENDKQREPDVEPLRQLVVCNKCLANGMCKPMGIPHVFIEDSLKPIDNKKGGVSPDELGCIPDVGDAGIDPFANPNDCRVLTKKFFEIEKPNLANVRQIFGEFMLKEQHQGESYVTKGAKDMVELTSQGCQMTKTYKIVSECVGTLYLSRNKATGKIEEICISDLTNPEQLQILLALDKEEVVPIQPVYYVYVQSTNSDLSLDQKLLKEFNIANWLRTIRQPILGPKIKVYQFLELKFLVNIDVQKINYLGIPDQYDDESLCNNFVFGDQTHAQYKDWTRWSPMNTINLYDDDFDLRLWEKSLQYAVDVLPLSHYQNGMGLGKPGAEKWTIALNANRCKFARIFIPVLWTGEGDEYCKKDPNAVNIPGPQKFRSVRVTQDEGVIEYCDGSGLSIQETYYIEVIITQETNPDYFYPNEQDVNAAKAKGYILQDYREGYEYAMNGFNSKVRLWVKPDVLGSSTRNLVCRATEWKKPVKFKINLD